MQGFKRNQIEEAVSQVMEPHAREPSLELRTRIKRLLETDRALEWEESFGGAPFAFFSADPPGSGAEIWFSEYEAFALLIGLLLMGHGWPQSFAVKVMRLVRSDLEREHARTASQDRKWLFDREAIRRNAQEGDFAFDNQDPVLLVIVSHPKGPGDNNAEPYACAVRRGPSAALKFVNELSGKNTGGWTMFELAGGAHRLSKALAGTKPRQRGRG